MCAKWTRIEPNNDLDKKLYETFTHKVRFGYAEFGEEKTVLPEHFANIAEKCENLEVKDSDVFITSYPKTGTTWCQEMLWMIINNVDFEGAKKPLMQRSSFLEFSGMYCFEEGAKIVPDFQLLPIMIDSTKCVDEMEDETRLIKSHLPWHLLPRQIRMKEKTPKIIYTTRNVKDTFVSYYYHSILNEGYNGDLETFCDLFLAGRVGYGNYWNHILGYWEQRNQPNLLLIKYEDMKRDLPSVLKKVAEFLDKSLTEEQISALEEHLSFEKMKSNLTFINKDNTVKKKLFGNNSDGIEFFRSGTVGSYKKDMTEEMEKKFDMWIEENTLKTGIKI